MAPEIPCPTSPATPKVFISYRREDTGEITGRIYDQLLPFFGEDSMFLDVDSIPAGVDFRDHIKQYIGRTHVLLAIIGAQWISTKYSNGSKAGNRRIDDADDYLRIELETAWARKVTIIPVLINSTAMPAEGELPPALAWLSGLNASRVRTTGPEFRASMEWLYRNLLDALGSHAIQIRRRNALNELKLKIDLRGKFSLTSFKVADQLLSDCKETEVGRLLDQIHLFSSGRIDELSFVDWLKGERKRQVQESKNEKKKAEAARLASEKTEREAALRAADGNLGHGETSAEVAPAGTDSPVTILDATDRKQETEVEPNEDYIQVARANGSVQQSRKRLAALSDRLRARAAETDARSESDVLLQTESFLVNTIIPGDEVGSIDADLIGADRLLELGRYKEAASLYRIIQSNLDAILLRVELEEIRQRSLRLAGETAAQCERYAIAKPEGWDAVWKLLGETDNKPNARDINPLAISIRAAEVTMKRMAFDLPQHLSSPIREEAIELDKQVQKLCGDFRKDLTSYKDALVEFRNGDQQMQSKDYGSALKSFDNARTAFRRTLAGAERMTREKKAVEEKAKRLANWVATGQPKQWVKEHSGKWNHAKWLELLESLRHSDFWPLDEGAVGTAIEFEKDLYQRVAEQGRLESLRRAALKRQQEEARRAAEAEATRIEAAARAARLANWIAAGHLTRWVKDRAGNWNHLDWTALLDGLRRSEFWPLDETALGTALTTEGKRQEEAKRRSEAEAFRAEQEELAKRKPTVKLLATVDGKEVNGAKVSYGANVWETPVILTLEKESIYTFEFSYKNSRGQEYSGEIQLTATWIGEKISQTALTEKKKIGYAAATQHDPWQNSLAMKFVPVSGTGVLFSMWHVRLKDYAAFAQIWSGLDDSWRSPGFIQAEDHPVVNVAWNDAQSFCQWLTEKERSARIITVKQSYRLPKDWEWSAAAGLNETPGTPEKKDSMTKDVYPWGKQWPPPRGAGNYLSRLNVDDYAFTSPVGNFEPNPFGLFDMGGNAWQWCEDFYDGRGGARVLRGASWDDFNPDTLLSSFRLGCTPDTRNNRCGFRIVFEGSNHETE